jgi:hypothetical protein
LVAISVICVSSALIENYGVEIVRGKRCFVVKGSKRLPLGDGIRVSAIPSHTNKKGFGCLVRSDRQAGGSLILSSASTCGYLFSQALIFRGCTTKTTVEMM